MLMTRKYATIITNFNTAANEMYADLELFKATPHQEKLLTMMHGAALSWFRAVAALIKSEEYSDQEKTTICTHACNELVSMELTKTAIKQALEQMEVSLKYPRIRTGKKMRDVLEDYRNFGE